MRIVSLVPSITELLYDLDLHEETVGITKFCVHPQQWYTTRQRVGGTKNVNIAIVKALHPTLIIASKEENVKEQVEELAGFCQVYVTDVSRFDEALQMIYTIGQLTGKESGAENIITRINSSFDKQDQYQRATAAYLIWQDPWMTVGSDTFIHAMMQKSGFENIIAGQLRYPEITIARLNELKPACVLLSSEPYPFKDTHATALQELLPASKIMLVDGEMFSWYGSRMLYAAGYFKELRRKLKQ